MPVSRLRKDMHISQMMNWIEATTISSRDDFGIIHLFIHGYNRYCVRLGIKIQAAFSSPKTAEVGK